VGVEAVTAVVLEAEVTDSTEAEAMDSTVEVMDTMAEATMVITAMDIMGAMATPAGGIRGSSALVWATHGTDIGVLGILIIPTMATAMAMVMGHLAIITDMATPTVDTATTDVRIMGIPIVPTPIIMGVMDPRITATQATATATELVTVTGHIKGGRVRGITIQVGFITANNVINLMG
jgi:hypothetical protein